MSSYDHITKFFAEADADGSGYLTLDELTAALRRNGYKGTDYEIRVSIMTGFCPRPYFSCVYIGSINLRQRKRCH